MHATMTTSLKRNKPACHLLVALPIGIVMILGNLTLRAQQPFGFRSNGQGRYPDATPVVEWGVDKNVVWKTPMPEWSNASPALGGDRVYVCAEPATLLCVNLADGKILWQKSNGFADVITDPAEHAKVVEDEKKVLALQKELEGVNKTLKMMKKEKDADSIKQVEDLQKQSNGLTSQLKTMASVRPPTHDANGYTSHTPVTDGKFVWAVFGTGVVVCYDQDGNRIWGRVVDTPLQEWGYCISPVLAGDVLVVQYRDMFGLDAATGKEHWKTKTPGGWGTPVLAKVGDQMVAFTGAGSCINTRDGKEVCNKLKTNCANSPVFQEGVLYYIQGISSAYKVSQDPVVKPELLWTNSNGRAGRHFSSPLIHDGYVYDVSQEGFLAVFNQKTGALVYEKKLDAFKASAIAYSSPTLAGKYILVSCENGVTLVIEPGPEYKQVASNTLEHFRCSPVFSGSRMYVRTDKYLYCIGK